MADSGTSTENTRRRVLLSQKVRSAFLSQRDTGATETLQVTKAGTIQATGSIKKYWIIKCKINIGVYTYINYWISY